MNMCAACLRKLYLEKYFGITVRFPLIWEDVSICCTAFSGGLLQLYGSRCCIRKMPGWIEKIPVIWGYVLTWILVVFMVVNILVSMAALVRYDMRANGKPAESGWEKIIDKHFDDERMDRIYPNAKPR